MAHGLENLTTQLVRKKEIPKGSRIIEEKEIMG
jgi:hypothetical protein